MNRLCAALLLGGGLLSFNTFAAGLPDSDWPAYNNTVDGQRYVALDQINTHNAGDLKPVCRVKVADGGALQGAILKIGKALYVTTADDTLAIDATTCAVLWRNVYTPQQGEVFPVNRGVAYANGRLFRGTPDGRLLAIDAVTGKTLWQEQAADPTVGEFFSAAPAAWEGEFIIGTAGSDWGARGRVMAFDQATGRELWRFDTVPMGDEPGAASWKDPRTARHGGGASWSTYTLDASSGEVFVPVANPAPDFSPTYRPGENLYTDSVVVLDARTGKLKWYYQLSPHDGHDLDLGAAPMLYLDKKATPMVALAGKDGHVYGLDRDTHKSRFRTAITTIEHEHLAPTPNGVHVCPGPLGGTEWNGVAFDHKTDALIVPAVDWCALLKSAKVEFTPGSVYMGGSWVFDKSGRGWINALNPQTGKLRWRYHAEGPVVAGVTPTAGGVTFTGDMLGHFLVLDSATGKLLFKDDTGGAVAGGVISYAEGGRQYVALTSGNVSRFTWGALGTPTLLIYALPTSPH